MKYEKMNDCFASLNDKVSYAFENSDLKKIFDTLDSIKGPTLVSGVGGSSIVAMFLAKVLREKRHLLATFVYPRDLKYMDISGYENVIAVSYSGNNIGVSVIYDLALNKYLFTATEKENTINIVYKMIPEISYVSICATIVPMAILALYYHNDKKLIEQIIENESDLVSDNDHFEVMSGYETSCASLLFESGIIESGLGVCIVHDKYNYCHGRINITKAIKSDLIFYKNKADLDEVLYNTLSKYYQKIFLIERKYDDDVINDLYASIVSLKTIRNIAQKKNCDISDMKEVKDNDVLYRYDGLL